MTGNSTFRGVLNLKLLPPISDVWLSVFGVWGQVFLFILKSKYMGKLKIIDSEELLNFLSMNREWVRFPLYSSA